MLAMDVLYVLAFFGAPGLLVGLILGGLLHGRLLRVTSAVLIATATAWAAISTTASGESADILGVIVAAFQIAGYVIGACVGTALRHLHGRGRPITTT